MPDKKINDRRGAHPPEPIDAPDDRSDEVMDLGIPEPDDSYQSREGYDDLGGGFLPDEGEPNDEPEVRRKRDDEET
jgi:hypothetical protein